MRKMEAHDILLGWGARVTSDLSSPVTESPDTLGMGVVQGVHKAELEALLLWYLFFNF